MTHAPGFTLTARLGLLWSAQFDAPRSGAQGLMTLLAALKDYGAYEF